MHNHIVATAALSLLLGLGSATTAWGAPAYRDADSGFRLRVPEASVQLAGNDFYGYILPDLREREAGEAEEEAEGEVSEAAAKARYDHSLTCTLYAVPAAQVEAATGKPFSTEEFLRYYESLSLMERNDINPNKISYALYDLDTYRIPDDGKGTAGPLSLLPSSLLDNADVSLSTLKKGAHPYVRIHLVEKLPAEKDDTSQGNFARHDMELALTSANDVLYIAMTAYKLPNLNQQKEYLENDYTLLKRRKEAKKLTSNNKAVLAKHREERDAFLQGLSLFPPTKESQPFGYTDPESGKFQRLGRDWVYFQGDWSKIYGKARENGQALLAIQGITLPKLYGIFGDTLAATNYGSEAGSLKPESLWKRQLAEYPAMFYSYYGTYPDSLRRQFKTNPHSLKWMGLLADVGITMALQSDQTKKYLEMTHFDTRQEDLSNAVRVYLNGEGNLRNQEGTPRKKTPVHLDGQVTFWLNKMKVNLLARWNGTPLEDGMETLVLRAEEKPVEDKPNVPESPAASPKTNDAP